MATIVIIAAVEGLTRWLKLAPPLSKQFGNYINDPYLPYIPRPNTRLTGKVHTGEFDIDYSYNNMGFRDVDHSLEKPAGVFRILGLGDSFTEGSGVDLQHTYLYRLEEMLNRREGVHPKVEIIKAGIGGYSAEPERLLLQHYGVRFQPDLILVAFLPNDIWDASAGVSYRAITDDGFLLSDEARQLGPVGKWLYLHSHCCRILLARYVNYKIRQRTSMVWEEVGYSNRHSEAAWKKIEVEYSRMSALARQMNAGIVFVHIPQQFEPVKREGGLVRRTFPGRKLYEWCQSNSQKCIDVMPAMNDALLKGPLYYKHDGHCNAEGYRVIAEALYDELTRQGLVP